MTAQIDVSYPNEFREPSQWNEWTIRARIVHPQHLVRDRVHNAAVEWCRANLSAEAVLWCQHGHSVLFKYRDDLLRFKLGFEIPPA